MQRSNAGINLNEYEPNPLWDIIETSTGATIDEEESYLTFTITMKRHPRYFMLNIFLPIIVLMLLNIGVFLLPVDCGEKNSYAITVFLSFVIFLTIVDSSLPKTADTVSLFQMYLFCLTIQSTLITIMSLVLTRLSTFNEEKITIPAMLLKVSRLVRFGGCCRRRLCSIKGGKSIKVEHIIEQNDDTKTSENENYVEPSDTGSKPTWPSVVNGLDAFCLVLFSVFSIVYTLLYVAICPNLAAAK